MTTPPRAPLARPRGVVVRQFDRETERIRNRAILKTERRGERTIRSETRNPVDETTWRDLQRAATDALAHSYSPYSQYPVGAAALVDDGRVVTGANIENASYGVTLCAECSMVSALFMSGGGKLVAFVCVDGHGEVLMPCGRCRQLLYEHRAPGMELLTVSGVRTMDQVLPDAFGPENL